MDIYEIGIGITIDYLTFSPFEVEIYGDSKSQKGYFARISGDVGFDGIVEDIQPNETGETIAIRPLQALFDYEIFTSECKDIAQYIYNAINDNIVNNSDNLQNRPIRLSNNTALGNRPMQFEKNKIKLLSLISDALTIYHIAVNCKLDINSKKIDVKIEKVSSSIVLEADKKNIINKNITIEDSSGSANKMIIRKVLKNNDTGAVSILSTVSFFLHTDGTVTAQNTDRISPVFCVIDDLNDSEDWDKKALEKAGQKLTPKKYNNEIELTYPKKDRLVTPEDILIGTQAKIYYSKKPYTSILTAKTITKDNICLKFGCVRTALTDKLTIERRKND